MYEIHLPSTLIIGGGSRHKIGELAKKNQLNRVLLISDRYLDQIGVVSEAARNLEDAGAVVIPFLDVNPDPTVENVENGLEMLKKGACTGIVAIGGGSSIDTAKAVSIMGKNPGWIGDYMGYHKVKNPGIPLIAIPTTAGTGSEVTRVSIITDTKRNIKMMCLDNEFLPCASIVDYELTMTMPKHLIAGAGIDSLTHAVEAYVSAKANDVTDMYALSAIALIHANILASYHEPADKKAKEAVMLGATQAGIAFSNASVCAVHGMSRPIGANFHIAHGLSNAMLLPLVTEHSIKGAPARYAKIARTMQLCGSEVSDKDACSLLVEELKALNRKMAILNLKEFGVDQDKYDLLLTDMAKAALASGSPGNNPVVFSEEEIINLYALAYDYFY